MEQGSTQWKQRYAGVLHAYLRGGGEIALHQGYELARRALAEGCGIVEFAAMHQEVLVDVLRRACDPADVVEDAGAFFAECLSPFEMSQRGAQEGARAMRHVNELLETELRRVAHALHDEAGQLLASVHIALADVAEDIPPQARVRFEAIKRLLVQIEVELRNLSHELRPTVLDNLGLVPALEMLADKVSRRTGLAVTVDADSGERLPSSVETALYRSVQEALNNAVKHAHARSVRIALHRTRCSIECAVCDDGIGCDKTSLGAKLGLGLLGIRERLNAVGGSLQIGQGPVCGTKLTAEVPL